MLEEVLDEDRLRTRSDVRRFGVQAALRSIQASRPRGDRDRAGSRRPALELGAGFQPDHGHLVAGLLECFVGQPELRIFEHRTEYAGDPHQAPPRAWETISRNPPYATSVEQVAAHRDADTEHIVRAEPQFMPAERCPLSQGLAQSEGPWRERRSTSQATMVAEPLPTRLPAGYRAHRGLAPRVGSPERRQLARRHARLVKCRSACPGKTRRDFAGFPVFDVVQTPTLWQRRDGYRRPGTATSWDQRHATSWD